MCAKGQNLNISEILVITFHQIKNIHTTTSDNQNLSVFENVNVKILVFKKKILVFFYRCTQYLLVTPEDTVKRTCCFGNFLGPFRFPRKPQFTKSLLAATQRAGQQILRLPISFKNVFLCSLLEELLQQPYRLLEALLLLVELGRAWES